MSSITNVPEGWELRNGKPYKVGEPSSAPTAAESGVGAAQEVSPDSVRVFSEQAGHYVTTVGPMFKATSEVEQ